MSQCLLEVRVGQNDLVVSKTDELAVDGGLAIALPLEESVVAGHEHRQDDESEEHDQGRKRKDGDFDTFANLVA